MAGILDQLIQQHGPEIGKQISGKLGIPSSQAEGLIPALGPMILGGLQRQAQNNGGEARVDHILEKHADDSILDNLGGFFSNAAEQSAPDPGLGGLLGDSGFQATNLIADQLGIKSDQASQIIPMLAPIIMGFVLKQRNQAGGAGTGTGALMGMLDADGDGSILDDVAGMLGGGGGLADLLGGGAPAQKSSGGGILGSLLGGLFGGNKKR